jgi:type VI secretion system protein ImpK
MINASDDHAKAGREHDEVAPSPGGNLALLYDAILTSIVRLQASRQQIPDVESFRKRIKGTLQEIERVTVSSGYDGQDIRDTHFAVVALLDSVVLHSNAPARAEWEKRLLQQELFGQTDAGVVFFEKLANLQTRRDSEQLANILEVYLLCLLLGFEGRYSGGMRAELDGVAGRTRQRIDEIRRRGREVSPEGVPGDAPASSDVPQNDRKDRFLLTTIAAIAFTVLCFLFFKVNLIWAAEQLRSQLP